MLVGFFVPRIAIGIRKFRVASFFCVGIVTNGKICSSSEGWAKVEGVENCTFLVNQGHLLLEGEREEERLFPDVSMKSVSSRFPRD